MMYYLIWMCSQCSMAAPVNVGLFDNITACETAKSEVVKLSDRDWSARYMRCIPKGVIK